MTKLSREDALAFYKRFYAPNNAIVVVTGDVTAEEVKALAEATYGALQAQPGHQAAPAAAGAAASRRRAASSSRTRAPATPRCGASTSRPAIANGRQGRGRGALPADEDRRPTAAPAASIRSWWSEEKIASSAGGWYSGTRPRQRLDRRLRRGRRRASASTRSRPAIDAVLHELREKRRHRPTSWSAPRRPSSPSSSTSPTARASLARRYGEGLLLGLTIDADQRLAGGHRQGDRRRREARRRQVSRHPPLGDRHADPDAAGRRKATPPKPASRRSPEGETAMTLAAADCSRRRGRAALPRRSSACRRASLPIQQGTRP